MHLSLTTLLHLGLSTLGRHRHLPDRGDHSPAARMLQNELLWLEAGQAQILRQPVTVWNIREGP